MSRIAFFDVAGYEQATLNAARFGSTATAVLADRLDERTAELVPEAEVVSAFVHSRVTEDVLAALPRLRLLAMRSTGFDNVDLEACRRRGICVANVPSYCEEAVAEHAFALLLALSRKLPLAQDRARVAWRCREDMIGRDLAGQTFGVVGTGKIGAAATRLALGASMRVVAFDLRPEPSLATLRDFRYAPLDTVLQESDVVSLHLPLNARTRHLIDRVALNKMKRGAILLNTARGGIIDTAALLEALEQRWLGGAGLDVVEGEELIGCSAPESLTEPERTLLGRCERLLARDDVVLTPHVAFFTRQSVGRLLDGTLENIRRFLAGDPQNLVLDARIPA